MTTEYARFDLSTLAAHEVAELGSRVRRVTESRTGTLDEISAAILDAVWAAFEQKDPPAIALLRMYIARDVEGERRLVLAATRGIEPAWNDVASSQDHRSLPLGDRDALARAPMVSKLVADLKLDRQRTFSTNDDVFFVANAQGSPYVPAQVDFVVRYGVRSVVGSGGSLPGGTDYVLVLFSRVAIPHDVASSFAVIALHAGLALSHATDLDAPIGEILDARARGLERALLTQEYLYLKRADALVRDTETYRQKSVELEAKLRLDATSAHQRQERTQRAMLNVIEDLREARGALEQRVIERTLELERANAELRATNSELEQFAYVASHDLQEPLRTIAGYLQLLQERYGEQIDADGHEYISFAVRGATRMQELIDALLTYSRVARAPLEQAVVSLDQTLDEALDALSRTIHESRATIQRSPLVSVRGDAVLLRQLFQNLISNAVKFCGTAPPRIEVFCETVDREVLLTIRDHGIGFDPKYAEQIFKVFRRLQRKHPGTGIGLAIVRKIVERHGGTIRAVSSPGQGATFITTLPAFEGIS